MRTLSATEAITPAIEHAKSMFLPFSLRRVLKLGLVAFLAELGAQFLVPPVGNTGPHPTGQPSFGVTPHLAIALAIAGTLILLVALCMLYFGSRMQFVLMDLIAYRTTLVGPSWRRHGPRTWPWIGLKIASFLLIFLVIGTIAAWPFLHVLRSVTTNAGQPPSLGNFLLIFAIVMTAVIVMMLSLWFLRDFVLPFMVFDGSTVRVAVSSAVELVRREPGSCFLYFVMKFVLTIVAAVAAELCIVAAGLIAAVPIGLVGGGLWFFLHQAGPFSTVFLYVSLGLLGLIFVVLLLLAIVCIAGVVLVFYQAYALYFLGGRIPVLGDLLEPPPPPFPEGVTPNFNPA